MQTHRSLEVDPHFVSQVQQNFITYFRLFDGLPGITFNEGNSTWITSTGLPGNHILSTQFSDDEADQQIDDTLRRIGQTASAVDWYIFPGSQPQDIGSRLVARGAAGGPDGAWMLYGNIGAEPGTWMLIDLDAFVPSPPVPQGFRVRQVTNQAMLDEWTEINARGFGATDYSAFHAAYARLGFGAQAPARHFIGYLGGEAVTSATLFDAGGSASVYNVSVPVEWRRRGFGAAITHAALVVARDRGYHTSWIWSSPMGRSVYARLGFVITDLGIREYRWKKR